MISSTGVLGPGLGFHHHAARLAGCPSHATGPPKSTICDTHSALNLVSSVRLLQPAVHPIASLTWLQASGFQVDLLSIPGFPDLTFGVGLLGQPDISPGCPNFPDLALVAGISGLPLISLGVS